MLVSLNATTIFAVFILFALVFTILGRILPLEKFPVIFTGLAMMSWFAIGWFWMISTSNTVGYSNVSWLFFICGFVMIMLTISDIMEVFRYSTMGKA